MPIVQSHHELRIGDESVPAMVCEVARAPRMPRLSIDGGSAVDELFDVVSDHVRAGALVVLTGTPQEFDRQAPADIATIVETIGECGAITLVDFGDADASQAFATGVLMAASDVLRTLLSYTDPLPAPELVYRSTPLRWDYSLFSSLFEFDLARFDNSGGNLPPDVSAQRRRMYGIGQRMGELHRLGFIWPDAHIGNFARSEGRTVILDQDDLQVLYQAPSAARSALDLVPLMSEMHPPSWQRFVDGYVDARGADASVVLEFVRAPAHDARYLRPFHRRRVGEADAEPPGRLSS